MRKLVYDLLAAHAPLTTVVPMAKVFERGAITESRPADPPFLVYTVNGRLRGISGPVSELQVWVYDERGDYTRIDQVHRILRALLSSFAEQTRTRSDGSVVKLVAADFQAEGPDLNDDVYRCNTRSGTWRLIGSGQ